MKTFLCSVLAGLMVGNITAQIKNEKGLYITNDGDLYTGILVTTNQGIKSEASIENGELNGNASYYFVTGKIMESGTYTHGLKDQKWVRYNENGSISAIAFYTLGKKSGTWLVYDDKGNKRFEMQYANGEKTGTWTNWDENGQIVSTKDYGKLN